MNDSYVGGMVRQYGNFSFTRVFQAGHEVPAYQPETAYEIFRRAMNNLDIATGNRSTLSSGPDVYASSGMADTFGLKQVAPPPAEPTCYILSLGSTCTPDQRRAVINGSAIIKDYMVVDMKTGGKGGSGGKNGTSGKSGASSIAPSSAGIWSFIILLIGVVALL